MQGAWPPVFLVVFSATVHVSALKVHTGAAADVGVNCTEQPDKPCCDLLNHGTPAQQIVVDWSSGAFVAPQGRFATSPSGCGALQGHDALVRLSKEDANEHPYPASSKLKQQHGNWNAWQVLPIIPVLGLIASKASDLHQARRESNTAHLLEMLASLLLFVVSGPAVILLNKRIMREYNFHFPIVLSSLGNLFIMAVTRVSNALGCYSLKNPTMEWKRYVRVVLLLNVFNFGTQVMGMWSYLFVSVPEIQILKSATVVLTMVFAVIVVKEPYNSMLALSIGVITAGTVVTAVFDGGNGRLVGSGTGAQIIGITLCVLASAFEAAKSVCSQVLMDGLPVFDGLYWCSPAFVLLAVIFVAALELKGLIHYEFSAALVGCLVANAVLTGVIVLSSFWFVKLVGALSLKVVTQARTVGLILVSVFFFGEQCTDVQYIGYTTTVVGMGLYNHFKNSLPKSGAGQRQEETIAGKHQLEEARPLDNKSQ